MSHNVAHNTNYLSANDRRKLKRRFSIMSLNCIIDCHVIFKQISGVDAAVRLHFYSVSKRNANPIRQYKTCAIVRGKLLFFYRQNDS